MRLTLTLTLDALIIIQRCRLSLPCLTVPHTGLVTIEAPKTRVCYQSSPVLKCTFEETTESAGWKMSNRSNIFELNNGSVVQLNHHCATDIFKSCTEVTLRKVPGIWAGGHGSSLITLNFFLCICTFYCAYLPLFVCVW